MTFRNQRGANVLAVLRTMSWEQSEATPAGGHEITAYLHPSERADTPASAPHSTPPWFFRQVLTSADIHTVVNASRTRLPTPKCFSYPTMVVVGSSDRIGKK